MTNFEGGWLIYDVRNWPSLTQICVEKSRTSSCYLTISQGEFTRVNSGSFVDYHAVTLLYFGHQGNRSSTPIDRSIVYNQHYHCYMMSVDCTNTTWPSRYMPRRVLAIAEGESLANYLNYQRSSSVIYSKLLDVNTRNMKWMSTIILFYSPL